MNTSGVLVVGSANMDMVVVCEEFPKPGETILGRQFGMFAGGKGANQAVCSAKLGGDTFFVGKMGNDIFREKLSQNMKSDGVRLDYLLIDNAEPTGIALITVNGYGQNEIVVVSGSNMKLTPEDINSHEKAFLEAGVVITQLEIPLKTVMETARISKKHGAVFILNPAPATRLPDELLRLTDYITPNEIELEMLSGIPVSDAGSATTAAKRLIDKGVKNVVVTLGSKGALLVNRDRSEIFTAREVDVVDSTAAGDAFNGALAFAISEGKTIDEAIRFANIVASYSVTKLGAQTSMPTMDEIKAVKML
ncbi:MAG: ribokinase [Ignavibacteria bacterium]|jgi:ribokinase|nr:ribokinase [Ignavibacteria bacterium]MCU7504992.1 ribokinase [Ignavibacteria bacterium]MCU7514874.1 ribokinase [Ignavibacteria bacterium]